MNDTVLMATDLSAASKAVAECGVNLKQIGIRRVILAQCVGALPAASMAFNYDYNRATKTLEYERKILAETGLEVETTVVETTKAKAIETLASQKGAEMIVFGSHSQSLLHELVAGGMIRNLSLHSNLPLLVLPLTKPDHNSDEVCVVPGSCEQLLRHVLFPTDFSENADYAFSLVEQLIQRDCQKVTLLHIQDAKRIEPHLKDKLEEFNSIDEQRLQTLANRLRKISSITVDTVVKYGRPVTDILDFSKEHDVSIMILGAHGREFMPEAHLGNVSQALIRTANVPLIVVPTKY